MNASFCGFIRRSNDDITEHLYEARRFIIKMHPTLSQPYKTTMDLAVKENKIQHDKNGMIYVLCQNDTIQMEYPC